MIKFKPGVVIEDLPKEMYALFPILDELFAKENADAIITSARDGVHKKNSLHHRHRAFDLRSKHLNEDAKMRVFSKMKTDLSPFGYDILLEALGKPNEHFHIEHDPKQ